MRPMALLLALTALSACAGAPGGRGPSAGPTRVDGLRLDLRAVPFVESGIVGRIGEVQGAVAEHLTFSVWLGERPAARLIVQIVDAVGRIRVRHVEEPVIGSPVEVVVRLLDARYRRLPPGRYRLLVDPIDYDGISHGGDERGFEITRSGG